MLPVSYFGKDALACLMGWEWILLKNNIYVVDLYLDYTKLVSRMHSTEDPRSGVELFPLRIQPPACHEHEPSPQICRR